MKNLTTIHKSKDLTVRMRQLDFTNQTNYEVEWAEAGKRSRSIIIASIIDVRLPEAVRDICRQFLNERENDA